MAKIFGISRRTIAGKIRMGLVSHSKSTPPFEVEQYNAEHAQMGAEAKISTKGLVLCQLKMKNNLVLHGKLREEK